MHNLRLIMANLLVVGVSCIPGISTGITGGEVVSSDTYLGTAVARDCSATVLNNHWVIASYHCGGTDSRARTHFDGLLTSLSGERKALDSGFSQNVDGHVVHPRMGPGEYLDVVLIRLDKPIEIEGSTAGYRRGILPLVPTVGDHIRCVGWGHNEHTGNDNLRVHLGDFKVARVEFDSTPNGPHVQGDVIFHKPALGSTKIEPGDSGGGCFMKRNADGVDSWYLTTVVAASQFSTMLLTPKVLNFLDGTMFSAGPSVSVGLASVPAVTSTGPDNLDIFWIDSFGNLRTKRRDHTGWVLETVPKDRGFGDNLGKPDGVALTTDAPAAVASQDGYVYVFARGSDNNIWQRYAKVTSTGRQWLGDWYRIVGPATSGPAIASWGPQRLDLFARGTNGELRHAYYDHGWGQKDETVVWEDLGGWISGAPAAVSWGSGRIDVFARGAEDYIYHRWYQLNLGWRDWETRGGPATSAPAVSSDALGRLDVFARSRNGTMLHTWYEGGVWLSARNKSHWIDTDHTMPAEADAVSWGRGRIDVFSRNAHGHLWHAYSPR